MSPFHASQLKSLALLVEQEIERLILTGEIRAGDRVNEQALARTLGVSRGPVREALQALRRAGLVEIVANRGAIVRSLRTEDALELYRLRGAIFAMMAERVAQIRSDGDLARLKRNVEDGGRAIEAGDREAYYALNLAFHDMIGEISGLHRALTVYRDLVKEMHLFRRRGLLSSADNLAHSHEEHRAILAAVEARDGERAFQAARGHIASGRSRFEDTLERHREAPAA